MSKAFELLKTKQCHECGEHKLKWFTCVEGRFDVPDGRHKINEIQVMMLLGCDYCSETIGVVSSDDFLNVFNGD